jgi:Tfp pilus assembly PilM family ATPase
VQYEKRLADLDARLQESQSRLQQARNGRALAEQQIASYQKVQRDLRMLYNERWSTQTERLTALISEVKKLVTASHMDGPRSLNFTHTDAPRDQSGLGSVGTSTVGITFTVQGTYDQVRRLINLFELSDQFVIIDGIGLSGTGPDSKVLTMNLRLKTLFRDPARAAALANKEL